MIEPSTGPPIEIVPGPLIECVPVRKERNRPAPIRSESPAESESDSRMASSSSVTAEFCAAPPSTNTLTPTEGGCPPDQLAPTLQVPVSGPTQVSICPAAAPDISH